MSIINKYDLVFHKIDKKKPFVNIAYKSIVARFEKTRKYYLLASRYDKDENTRNYFIIRTDEKVDGAIALKRDDYGRYKFYIGRVWKFIGFSNKTSNFNIELKLIETDAVTDVYKIII